MQSLILFSYFLKVPATNIDEHDFFLDYSSPVLSSMEIHNFTHFLNNQQNYKMSPWWLPNQGERLDRIIEKVQSQDKRSFLIICISISRRKNIILLGRSSLEFFLWPNWIASYDCPGAFLRLLKQYSYFPHISSITGLAQYILKII